MKGNLILEHNTFLGIMNTHPFGHAMAHKICMYEYDMIWNQTISKTEILSHELTLISF